MLFFLCFGYSKVNEEYIPHVAACHQKSLGPEDAQLDVRISQPDAELLDVNPSGDGLRKSVGWLTGHYYLPSCAI